MAKEPEFRVNLGDAVQLQYLPEDERERLNTTVLGHAPGQSIILSTPTIQGKYILMRENQRFSARMMIGTQVAGFETEVLKSYNLPYPHIHIRQPYNVEALIERSDYRVKTEMVVSVRPGYDPTAVPVPGFLIDLSASGAMLRCTEKIGMEEESLTIAVELVVSKIKYYLSVNATIKNLMLPDPGSDLPEDRYYQYGLLFDDMEDNDRMAIYAFVYEHLVQGV